MTASGLLQRSKRTAATAVRWPITGKVWWAGVVVLGLGCVLGLSGCGSDGSSGLTLPTDPPKTEEKITGLVLAPNGAQASAPHWWEGLQIGLSSPAYALRGVTPVSDGLPVSLSMLDATDFADGSIDSPRPLITATL